MSSYHVVVDTKPSQAIKQRLQDILRQLQPQVPFLVVVYNNQVYLEHMVEQLKRFNIIPVVFDNQSSCPDMINYLDTIDRNKTAHVVRMNANYGHTLISQKDIYDLLPQYFIYSDPDILFNANLPLDFVERLKNLTESFKFFKAGFNIYPLSYYKDKMIPNLTCKPHIRQGEMYQSAGIKNYYASEIKLISDYPEIYVGVIDTQTALYNKQYYLGDFNRSIIAAGDLSAVHMPWFEETDLLTDQQLQHYQRNNLSSTVYGMQRQLSLSKRFTKDYFRKSALRKLELAYQKHISAYTFVLQKYINSVDHTPIIVEYSEPYDNLDYVINKLESFGLKPFILHYQPWNIQLKRNLKRLRKQRGLFSLGLLPTPQKWSLKYYDFFNETLYAMLPDKFIYTNLNIQFHDDLKPDFILALMQISETYKANKVGLAVDLASIPKDYTVSADSFHYGYHNRLYRTFQQHETVNVRQALSHSHTRPIAPSQHMEYEMYYGLNYKILSYYNKKYSSSSYTQGILVAGNFTASPMTCKNFVSKC